MAKLKGSCITKLFVFFAIFVRLGQCSVRVNGREATNGLSQMKQLNRDAAYISESEHIRVRRDVPLATGDAKCQQEENSFIKQLEKDDTQFVKQHHFVNESKFTISLAWVGENSGDILVMTAEEHIFTAESKLYRSTDAGKTFKDVSQKIDGAIIKKEGGLQKHPLKPTTVFIISHGDTVGTTKLYITENGGESFFKREPAFSPRGNFIFHPSKDHVDKILAVDTGNGLWLTTDEGLSWKKIQSDVATAKWCTVDKEGKTIFTLVDSNAGTFNLAEFFGLVDPTANGILEVSEDLGNKWTTVKQDLFTFAMQGKFIFVSKSKDEDKSERYMEVSTDKGKSWYEVQLPSISQDRFYTIMDMNEGMVFMHVDNPGDTGHGTIFTSDATGIVYSESLTKHLYPNYKDITDFYRVQSMRGVYIASQLLDDNSIRTVITYDRGGEWKPIDRPLNGKCKDESKPCYLHIHNQYSISRHVKAQPPLSVDNAKGLILVHGHVAESLQTTDPDVFVSSDGGYTWSKSLDGPHHYQIADQGGLLIAVPADTDTPKVVKFSTDEGRCWHQYNFTTEDIMFTGLLTEPGNKAMSVAIWGYTATSREWKTFSVNFAEIITTPCGDSDYETWIPHMDNTNNPKTMGCLLGAKEKFSRLKKDSWCLNGHAGKILSESDKTYCECTEADYDCDYGYHREVGSTKCVEDKLFRGKEIDICLRNHEEEIVSEGYHKIPGDKCLGGHRPKAEKMVDLRKRCSDGFKPPSVVQPHTDVRNGYDKMASINGAIIITAVLIILTLVLLGIVYLTKRYRERSVTFRYSSLNTGDFDNELEAALQGGTTSLYEDESEVEDNRNNPPTIAPTSIQKPSNGHGPPPYSVKPDVPALGFAGGTQGSTNPNNVKSYHDDSDEDLLE